MSLASKLVGAVLFSAIASLGVAGCASEVSFEEDLEESESDLSGTRRVRLMYEGTCQFLRNCSSYSRNLPAGKVNWGCTGVGVCSDTAKWVAGPNRSYCGKTVTICNGSKCTSALVKDVSVARGWEAGNGVLNAIGLPHGLSGRCSGYGGGTVSVSMGGSAPTNDDDDDNNASGSADDGDATPPQPRDDTNDGCFSASCQKDMDELVCVQSKKTNDFYQCKNGKWYNTRGSKTEGAYGPCKSVHPVGQCGD